MKKENRLKYIANYLQDNLAGSRENDIEFIKNGYNSDGTYELYCAGLNLCLKIVKESRSGKVKGLSSIMLGYNDSIGIHQIYVSDKQILEDVKFVVRQINNLIIRSCSDQTIKKSFYQPTA